MGYSTSTTDDEAEDDYKSRKHKKQSKKLKRHKKEKKSKKKSKRHKRTSTSESSSGSESGSEPEWVEKSSPITAGSKRIIDKAALGDGDEAPKKSAATEENDWSNFNSFIPTFSNTAREKRQTKKEWDAVRSVSKPGQHARELNPYWKDGGHGLPSELDQSSKPTEEVTPATTIGDGGLHWLRKAYQRAKEQAKEEGRSLEEVAAERWGSLSNFYTMLESAEGKARNRETDLPDARRAEKHHSRSASFRKPRRDSGNSSDEKIDRESSSSRKSHSYSQSHSAGQHQPKWMKQSSATTSRQADERISPPPPTSAAYVPKSTPPQCSTPTQEDAAEEPDKPAPKVLTDQEMNSLSAKILKAEMLGNQELVAKLKLQHSEAEANRQAFIKGGGDSQASAESSRKVVTKIVMESQNRGRRKDKPTETHQSGQRVRYFPDDDKQSLQNMFQREKTNTVENENALFSRLAGKGMKSKPTDDYDLDDIFADKASSVKKAEKEKEREVHKVIQEEAFYKKKVDDCPWCFDGRKLEKHIVASIANNSYLCVPPFQSLTEGHCLIVPMFHVSSATELDEDVWEEIQKFRHALVRMFKEDDQDLIIFESAMHLNRHPHMYLECVPIPKETGDVAPIYFKKAIQECESEWAQNKKLVELRDRGVRKAIPKGLPYFSVDFGDDSGFAHVIEDEKNFPRNFAQEIIGGMMELDHSIWRKRKNDNFKDQREKVMKFLTSWGPFDWTRDG